MIAGLKVGGRESKREHASEPGASNISWMSETALESVQYSERETSWKMWAAGIGMWRWKTIIYWAVEAASQDRRGGGIFRKVRFAQEVKKSSVQFTMELAFQRIVEKL